MINWKNTAENLALILITGVLFCALGLCGGYFISIKSSERMVLSQKSLIEQAIEKDNTAITNNVSTEIKRIKSKKSEPIVLDLNPLINSEITQKQEQDTVSVTTPKKSFFKRLFTKD